MKKNKPLLVARGGLKVGNSFLHSAQVTWPFGKIKVYENKIFLTFDVSKFELKYFVRGIYSPVTGKRFKPFHYPKIRKTIIISFKEIIGYKMSSIPLLNYLVGRDLIIYHKNKKYPRYICLSLFGHTINRLVRILKSSGKKEIRIKKPIFERIISLGGYFLVAYIFGNLVFGYKIKVYLILIYLLLVILYYRYRDKLKK